MSDLVQEFKEQSIYQIDQNLPRIKKCLDQLTEKEVWQKPNGSLNSIGNLILHLCGNIGQYAISSLGNQPDTRKRSKEFNTEGGFTKTELTEKIEQTIDDAKKTIQQVSEAELLRKRNVQAFNYSGIGIIIHVTEHLSYHTGQIAFWTKFLKNRDLGFYPGINLEENQ